MGKQLDRDKVVKFLAHNRSAYCIDYGLLIDSLNSGAFDIDQEAEQLPIKERELTLDQRITNEEQHNLQVYRALEDRTAKLEEAVTAIDIITITDERVAQIVESIEQLKAQPMPVQESDVPEGFECRCMSCRTPMTLDEAIQHKCKY
jgi:hypothetical protein